MLHKITQMQWQREYSELYKCNNKFFFCWLGLRWSSNILTWGSLDINHKLGSSSCHLLDNKKTVMSQKSFPNYFSKYYDYKEVPTVKIIIVQKKKMPVTENKGIFYQCVYYSQPITHFSYFQFSYWITRTHHEKNMQRAD